MKGIQIKNKRADKELSQKMLAKIMEVPVETIDNWENNLEAPNKEQLEKLSKILECDKKDIYDGKIIREKTNDIFDPNYVPPNKGSAFSSSDASISGGDVLECVLEIIGEILQGI